MHDLKNLPKHHPTVRLLTGKTPFFTSSLDQRFSFGLYIPKCHSFKGPPLNLLVAVHGTKRQTGGFLNKLQDFCQRNKCAILCPLFPAGIEDPLDLHNYKTVFANGIRFDEILLSMIDQAAGIWSIKTAQFFIHGFSGGGQFVHRFLYLHPDRLAGVSIGAPGRITPPDINQPWPAGLSNVADIFDIPEAPVFPVMKRVPVQLVVGADDLDTSMLEVVKKPNAAETEAGLTRVARLRWLRDAFIQTGFTEVTLSEVPNVGHDGAKCLPAVEAWLDRLLAAS